ncbi:flagellar hook assembly protein FlgD [Virgibacillus senegalensis]|uniref:flagellar hook assembly protein FlgD n=1 Tax=Virgibacillus senegalensis TaxID=1499679 RepID=UPI00069E1BF7|nr:flagellar hook assembly protein FlgD [Virgibacillus senegalensis]
MTKIDNSYYLSQQPRGTTNPNLGKDEFLKILMAQLQNQDPLNPMEDKEFVSQMASFSSLEQMTNMASSMDRLVDSQSISPVLQYSHLIGKEVSYNKYDEETGKVAETLTSDVTSVSQESGKAVLELSNGEKIFADEVLKVSGPSTD